jgi:hypothetical protein
MKSLKDRFAAAPEGTAVLFSIQIFSTLGFAVLYSTLVRFSPKPKSPAYAPASASILFPAFLFSPLKRHDSLDRLAIMLAASRGNSQLRCPASLPSISPSSRKVGSQQRRKVRTLRTVLRDKASAVDRIEAIT